MKRKLSKGTQKRIREILNLSQCGICLEILHLSNFYPKGKSVSPYCITCHLEKTRQFRIDNPDKDEQYKERCNERRRERRRENPEKEREYFRKWYKNSGHINVAEYGEQYRQRSKIKLRIKQHRRRSRIKTIPYTQQQLSDRFKLFNGCCAYCGKPKPLTIDHILPIAKGGLDKIENILGCCSSCNSSKNDSLLSVWYPLQSFYSITRYNQIKSITSSE